MIQETLFEIKDTAQERKDRYYSIIQEWSGSHVSEEKTSFLNEETSDVLSVSLVLSCLYLYCAVGLDEEKENDNK